MSDYIVDDIVVVCAANTCRSPMADKLLQQALPHKNISSAGLNAAIGQPMNEHSAKLLSALGIECSSHRSRQLTRQICQANQLILVMEKCHIQAILSLDASAEHKIVLVGKWLDDIEIADPYGQNFEIYQQSFHLIEKSIDKWIGKLT